VIEVLIHLGKNETTSFDCPSCFSTDTTYNGMAQFCWNCNHRHVVNIDSLLQDVAERACYHKHGRTSMRAKWRVK